MNNRAQQNKYGQYLMIDYVVNAIKTNYALECEKIGGVV